MVAQREMPDLAGALERLAAALQRLDLGPGLSGISDERSRLASVIRSYLIPRAQDAAVPLTVVFAGPTGSGKSTLINSLTGVGLTKAGALRPTTTAPVALVAREMTKHYARIGGVTCDVVGGEAPILKYLALVDTPDIDSTATDHRVMAEILMDNADTVVFVTSALRYADAVPWQVLRRARSRGTEVIHVLNRVTSATHGAVVDFKSRLDAAGLGTRVLTIPEHHLAPGAQQIPGVSVRALRRALIQLADDRARSAESTYDRVIGSVLGQVDDLCASVDETIDDLSRTRSRVTADLAQRVSSLDLSKAGSGLIDPAPPPGSPRRLRKWLRDGRRLAGLSDVSAFVAAVEAMVHRDLRLWLAEDWPDDVIGQERSIQRILPVLRVAVEGWIDFVRRMATERDEQGRGLAELVLLRASVVEGFEATADLVFGSDAPTFVDRARRELIGRLEVVYAQVSAHALDLIATGIGDPDLTGLRSTSDLVKFRLVSVDA